MIERFVPVPYAALSIAGPDGEVAVLRLYRRAHTSGWEPFPTNERELMAEWGLNQRKVSSILRALADATLIEVMHEGGKFGRTTVRVLKPYVEKRSAAGDPLAIAAARKRQPSARPAIVAAGDPLAIAAGALEGTRAQNRTEPNHELREREIAEADLAVANASAWSTFIAPGSLFAMTSAADQVVIRFVVANGYAAKDVQIVSDWLLHSEHREAWFFREGRFPWTSVCNARWPQRVELARAWDSAGRMDTAAPVRRGRKASAPAFRHPPYSPTMTDAERGVPPPEPGPIFAVLPGPRTVWTSALPLWERTLERMCKVIGPQDTATWLRPASPEIADGQLVLTVSNHYYSDWIRENYGDSLREASECGIGFRHREEL